MPLSSLPLRATLTTLGLLVFSLAQAATITVNSNFEGEPAGVCTLQAAVRAANTDTAVAACAAGTGPDTIVFNAVVFSGGAANTIGFTAPLAGTIDALRVTQTLTIDATAVGNVVLRRSGAANIPDFRLINLYDAADPINGASQKLTLRHITVTGGKLSASSATQDPTSTAYNNGGGIAARGALEIYDSLISNNRTAGGYTAHGGGIFAATTLLLQQSDVLGNATQGANALGGGIAAEAVALVQARVASNTTAGLNASGGGIFAVGVYAIDSTIAANGTAGVNAAGGGVHANQISLERSTVWDNFTGNDNSPGGGVYASTAALTNSTLSANYTLGARSNGGGIYNDGRLVLRNSTFVDNRVAQSGSDGNAIYLGDESGNLDMASTLLVRNSAIAPRATIATSGSKTSTGGNNLVIGTLANVTLPADTITNCAVAVVDDLAANGGATQTHALPLGSCAIDHGGNPQALATDQRGATFARIRGASADIGAFEVQATAPVAATPAPGPGVFALFALALAVFVAARRTGNIAQ
ncbi:MAG: hypothetical protein JSR65_04755 [Proteobacteria bacterium]|nr:hypothetical protein [Pseudomonadota bacterium]